MIELNLAHAGTASLSSPENIIVAVLAASSDAPLQVEIDGREPAALLAGEMIWLPAEQRTRMTWQQARVALVRLAASRLNQVLGDGAPLPDARHIFRDPLLRRLVALLAGPAERPGVADNGLYHDSLLNVALVRLIELSRRASDAGPAGDQVAAVRSVLRFVEAHLDEDLNLDRLSAMAHMSRNRFARLFRALVGVPPHHYVVERRVERARELLAADDGTIADIAYRVGFSSHSHLTTVFRRLVGVTPSQYRSQSALASAVAAESGARRTSVTR